MLNFSLAQELFLVLFSILYGVMLQSLTGLQPFPLARTFRGYIESNGKPKTQFEHCGKKSNSWLIWMWRKRVGLSFLLLTIFPAIYFWAMFELLGNPLLDSLHTLVLVGLAFWSALGVFGFYRFYRAIAVKYLERLFCDVAQNLEKREVSFDSKAHFIWGMFYLLPLVIMLLVQNWFLNLLSTVFSTISVMVTNVFSLEELIFVAVIVGYAVISIYLFRFIWRLERRYDRLFFMVGDAIFLIFYLFILFYPLEEVASLVSSLVIAELTLALVWVELSKRPELKLGGFVPIVFGTDKGISYVVYKTGFHDEEPKPSTFLKIKEVSHESLKFDEHLGFSLDLSNIGYEEIMVHDYIYFIDGNKQKPIPLGTPPYNRRLRLITQERHAIDIPPLNIKNAGFHKLNVVFSGMTAKCSAEVWFFISDDFRKLRYVEMAPYKRLLSPITKAKLKDL